MAYSAEILRDSISENGHRLTTIEATFPRIVLAEFNTHRVFSRNSASSRAIPVKKQVKRVLEDPFIPDEFGRNQSGMNPDLERPLNKREIAEASRHWLEARDACVEQVLKMLLGERALHSISKQVNGRTLSRTSKGSRFDSLCQIVDALPEKYDDENAMQENFGISVDGLLNLHKQYPNRLLEPFMWHTVIVTATEWENFYALRTDMNAQREIRLGAIAMLEAFDQSEPTELLENQWHLPLFDYENEIDYKYALYAEENARLISVGRCARVSYLTHDGKRDPIKDIELAQSLKTNGHMSPFEHVARPMSGAELKRSEWSGNFRGFHQYRKDIPYENNFAAVLTSN